MFQTIKTWILLAACVCLAGCGDAPKGKPAKQYPNLSAADRAIVAEIQKLGGADQAIVTAVSPRAFEQAFASLRRGGTLSMVGLPAENDMTLPIFETVLQGITVRGSIVGTRKDLAEVFELHRLGRTRVVRESRKLDSVNEDFAAVEAGEVTARLVFTF